jgi:hypothetical protein
MELLSATNLQGRAIPNRQRGAMTKVEVSADLVSADVRSCGARDCNMRYARAQAQDRG